MNLLSTAPCRYLVLLALLALPLASQADAFLEVSEFSTAQKKVLPLTSDEPKLFNIEFFSEHHKKFRTMIGIELTVA